MLGVIVFLALLIIGNQDGIDNLSVTNVLLFGILYYTYQTRDEVAK